MNEVYYVHMIIVSEDIRACLRNYLIKNQWFDSESFRDG